MKMVRFCTLLLLAMLSLAAAEPPAARNVILFLGDAGGIPTLNAASIVAHQKPLKLFIQHMPNIALSETSSASEWVTDSAAGMTAIVTGEKTDNGVLSLTALRAGARANRSRRFSNTPKSTASPPVSFRTVPCGTRRRQPAIPT